MEIREGTEQDIPEILNVLKASLGESSSEKTEDVWRFKHVNNPFGKSLVLLAVEDGKVIGVRAFMRWKWQKGKEVFSAFRAVDTATHPDHQGKGVFKKLTLKALEIGEERGDHFVFNTPNSQSKPGYLKMGWKEVDKLSVKIKPVNPLFWKKEKEVTEYPKVWPDNGSFDFLTETHSKMTTSGKLFTPKDRDFLKWRYLENPLQDYHLKATRSFFVAGYVKEHSNFRELRISELISASGSLKKELKEEVGEWAKKYGVHVVSYSPVSDLNYLFSVSGNFGPVLTFRNMAFSASEIDTFLDLDSWAYSLGDLELF